MNKLNPIEAVLGHDFELNLTVTGLDLTVYTGAEMYIDDHKYKDAASITNGLIKFKDKEFPTMSDTSYTVGAGVHEYSIVAVPSTTASTTNGKKVLVYKNSLNVLDDPTE